MSDEKRLGEVVRNNAGDPEIQVAFALHDRDGSFSRWVGSAMLSIIQNTKEPVWFHILLDSSVNTDNREKLRRTGEQGLNRITFHSMDESLFSVRNKYLSQYSIASLFRFALPNVLPDVEKVIYLDADLLFTRDIQELWNTDLEGKSIAAVHDKGFENGIVLPSVIRKGIVNRERYFNSGVLVLNLTKIRSEHNLLEEGMFFIQEHPETKLPDQDALNDLFRDDLKLLDEDWNCTTIYERNRTKKLRPAVYHFQGEKHPYFDDMTEYDRLLLRTQADSPWGYESIENEFMRGFNMLSFKLSQLQKLAAKLAGSGIKRIYYGKNTKGMRNLMAMVPPRNVDYCIEKDPIDVDGMRYGVPVRDYDELRHEQKGTFVIFVLPEADDGHAVEKLDKLGLVYGEDYFVVPTLITVKQGGYIV